VEGSSARPESAPASNKAAPRPRHAPRAPANTEALVNGLAVFPAAFFELA